MSELQTTGRRREVGAELRRIRKEREWPAYKLAERLRWTASHISRSEAGKRRVTDVDVGHYLGMCGAGADVLEDLLESWSTNRTTSGSSDTRAESQISCAR